MLREVDMTMTIDDDAVMMMSEYWQNNYYIHLYLLKRCNMTYSETWHNVSRTARLLTRSTHSRP